MVIKKSAKKIEKASESHSKKNSEALGISGLTIGIVGLVYTILVGFFNLPLFIVGFIFSVIQQKRNKTKIGLAGLIINIIGIILSVVLLIVFLKYIIPLMGQFQQTTSFPSV